MTAHIKIFIGVMLIICLIYDSTDLYANTSFLQLLFEEVDNFTRRLEYSLVAAKYQFIV